MSKIWDYTFEVWSETQADKYYYMLFDFFQELADGEVAGKNYSEVSLDIVGFKSGQHIIFYRKLNDNRIEIARVLHSRMGLRNRLQG